MKKILSAVLMCCMMITGFSGASVASEHQIEQTIKSETHYTSLHVGDLVGRFNDNLADESEIVSVKSRSKTISYGLYGHMYSVGVDLMKNEHKNHLCSNCLNFVNHKKTVKREHQSHRKPFFVFIS